MDRQVLRRGALLFVLLLAFALRVSGLIAQSLWRDEVDALRFAKASPTALASSFTRVGWNGPLYYVLLRFWVHLVGDSEFALRYFSLCFGLFSVALIYRLGRKWFSPLVGGLAALLAASSPYMVWYAQEAKMYALLCALAVGTLCVYHRALRHGGWRTWAAVVVLTWITVGVHIMGALQIPTMALLFPAWWPFSRKQWRPALLALAGTTLPGIVILPWTLPLLIRSGDIGHRFVPLNRMITTMLNAFSRGIVNIGGLWATGPALFALLAGSTLWPDIDLLAWLSSAVRGERRPLARRNHVDDHLYTLAAWMWLLVPLLGLYVISLRVPMFVDRYLIWIGPAFYLLMARGFDQVYRRSAVLSALCLSAILVLNCWGVWEQGSVPIKSDFRAAAAYVRQRRQPGELILFHISYVRETFEYYYGDASPAAGGIPTDDRTTQAMVDESMRERITDHDVVWLVLSEPEMWDRRGMTVAWLEAHGDPEMRSDFVRVSVVKYRILPEQEMRGYSRALAIPASVRV